MLLNMLYLCLNYIFRLLAFFGGNKVQNVIKYICLQQENPEWNKVDTKGFYVTAAYADKVCFLM